ncbi:MAG TPA: Ger(x)C family spore germination C-terminal domain-containing protein [Symbiobacteriaceae bacterium]|nr:Ger(x)C family spore germination C-terminal domain-containing protein [Symbiobacteriaceae bacterium]
MRRRRLLCILLLPALLLTACWDRTQLEDRYYVIGLGLDRHPSGKLLVSAQLAMAQLLAAGLLRGAAEPTESAVACRTLSTVAESIPQAMRILNASLTRSLTLKHLRAVVIGEDLGREGVEPYLMELWRHPESRGTELIAQARNDYAYRLLQECQPLGEINLSRVPEGYLLQQKRYHLAPPVRLHQFMIRMGVSGADPFLPSTALNSGIDRDPVELEAELESARAGELERVGGNRVEFLGTAIYRKDRLKGFLTVDETQLLLALRGEMGKAYVTFPDPITPERKVTLRFQQENLPRYRASFRDGAPHVNVDLLFEGEVLAVPGGTDYVPPAARGRLEAAAAREAERIIWPLLDKLRMWEADPVGFGLLFRGRFRDRDQWLAYKWEERVKELGVDVSVKMRIRRYGLHTGPDRTRGGR